MRCSRAKGLGQFAAGNRARIVRTVNGKQQEIKVKLDALVNSGDLTQNLPLHAGRRPGRTGNPVLMLKAHHDTGNRSHSR